MRVSQVGGKGDKDLQGWSQAEQKSQAGAVCDTENRRERTSLDCDRKFTLIHSQKWLGLKQISNAIY